MSMCRVFSCVVGRECLLWPVCSLGKTLITFDLLHSILQGQICLLLQMFLDFLLLHSSPLYWKDHLFWMVLWRPTRPFRTNTQKRCPFHSRGLEWKSRKSRNTWHNRQIWPWSTEWSRAKANRVLPKEHTGHSKHPLPTTQEKTLHMEITRWSKLKSDLLYSLQPKREKLHTVSKNKTGSWLCSDHELLIAKFRHKLKKVGKTTRLFRYDLNQIPYDYTVEVRNRFKGLDLIESLMNYEQRFVTLYRRQESRPSPWKRNAKRQNGCLRRPYK